MYKFNSLSQNELSVIMGGLLGDSSYSKKNNHIVFAHSINQKDYLEWKHKLLERISNPIHISKKGKSIITGEDLFGVNFCTKRGKDINPDYSHIRKIIFNDCGKKTVSRKWLNMLTPLSLAVWWMDDGCLSVHKDKKGAISRYGKLSTHGFSLEEQYIIKNYFKAVWDIDVKITPEKNSFFLRFTVPNLKKLFSIIYSYVIQIPSMIYKIDMKYNMDKILDDEYKEIQIIINKIKDNNI